MVYLLTYILYGGIFFSALSYCIRKTIQLFELYRQLLSRIQAKKNSESSKD